MTTHQHSVEPVASSVRAQRGTTARRSTLVCRNPFCSRTLGPLELLRPIPDGDGTGIEVCLGCSTYARLRGGSLRRATDAELMG